MKVLLIGGAPSVGKSETIYRLTLDLLSKGFIDTEEQVPNTFTDFRAILEGTEKNGQKIRVLINTATDNIELIKALSEFKKINGEIDLLISSIRDEGFHPRGQFFDITGINRNDKNIIEIPLGKITRKGGNFTTALNWYSTKMDELITLTLSNSPFNI